jgi:hypothetical protein
MGVGTLLLTEPFPPGERGQPTTIGLQGVLCAAFQTVAFDLCCGSKHNPITPAVVLTRMTDCHRNSGRRDLTLDTAAEEESVGQTKEDLLAETRELWGRRYGRPITDEEAQEIIDNMTAFAKLIIEWYLDEQTRNDSWEDSSDAP